MTNPTGDQYAISSGGHAAVVTEVGATLRAYSVDGRDIVRGFAEHEVIKGGRGQQLLPWPNRIRDGRFTFGGVEQQLALTEPARHNAIHGLARHVVWTLEDHTASSVRQSVRIFPQPGWPGIVQATITHTVSDDGLQVDVAATNVGDGEVPFGYAAHPYLTVGESVVDEVEVTVPAAAYLEVDDRLLPVEVVSVAGNPQDLRSGRPLGSVVLDTAFTDVARDADGRWRVKLALGDRYAELWAEQGLDWIQVFTGNDRRDLSLAVEPMTCGPNAFNDGPTQSGMITLAPGEEFAGRWGITGH